MNGLIDRAAQAAKSESGLPGREDRDATVWLISRFSIVEGQQEFIGARAFAVFSEAAAADLARNCFAQSNTCFRVKCTKITDGGCDECTRIADRINSGLDEIVGVD